MKKNSVYLLIPFKCPHGEFSCPFVNTMTSTLDADCNTCENFLNKDNTEENNYYDNKLAKNLAFMKFELKYLILIIWGGIGYYSFVHNHFTLFTIVSVLFIVYYFIIRFFKAVGKRNIEYDKTFNEKDSIKPE